jgi:Na+/H+ antiporter NhaD/arsenite permease-like protein
LHTAFFVFLVSNLGGGLTPMGPPLFLGYLKGVPFWWMIQRCWLTWSVALLSLFLIFYLVDRHNFHRAPVVKKKPLLARSTSRDCGTFSFSRFFANALGHTGLSIEEPAAVQEFLAPAKPRLPLFPWALFFSEPRLTSATVPIS